MFEATTTRHCSYCDTQLHERRGECPQCAAWVREREYKELVEKLLPYARLYSGPQDAPEFDSDTKKQARVIARAEKALRGIKTKWDEKSGRWVKQ